MGVVTAAHATRRTGGTGAAGARNGGAGGERAARELHSAQLVEIQRSRLIAGADREECLLAVLEELVRAIAAELATAELERLPWRERIRTGLWTILALFDREPMLARVCVVQALRGGPRVLEWRETVLASLAAVLDGGRCESRRGAECTFLTAEGLVGAAFGIVHARLLRDAREPLAEPQTPFEDVELHFFGGDRAPLVTPSECGAYTTTGTFTPWSETATVESSSTFNITTGRMESRVRARRRSTRR
jgi:AcrR family transcriptional regulator